jgi:choline kinase
MKKKSRIGVILAAGLGSRLYTFDSKPLIHVNNMELLLRTIFSLELAECISIVIVLGWNAKKIKEYISSKYRGAIELKYVFNPDYKLQNGISVLCAKPFIKNDIILTMADHILDYKIMELVKNHTPPDNGATLCVDYKLETIFDMDDATKVYAEDNLVKDIGKKIKKFNCIDTGVFIGTSGLLDAIEEVFKKNGDASLSEGVQLLASKGKMEALDIGDCFWQDVDTPEMLKHAEKLLKKHDKG